MKASLSRRSFLGLGGGLVAGVALARTASRSDVPNVSFPRFEIALPIPRALVPSRTDANTDYYDVVQREERVEILPGLQTNIWGYQGMFPGPTIKARRGRTVIVRQENRLSTPTAVHLHGAVSPPESDGFPTDCIMPGRSKTYVYPNNQRAATLWYHDHAMDRTGRNIYMGLAGLYLVNDDEEQALGLPDGPYDVPLLIQDRKFAPDGSLRYETLDHLGAKGGIILVNGAPWPRMEVATRKYRFRIVNGSNATPFRLALSPGGRLLQIATDGGLLPAPVLCPTIPLAMAERTEIIIDFSAYPLGTKLILQNLNTTGTSGPIANEIMQFHVVRREGDESVIPKRLCEFHPIDPSTATCTRDFVLSAKPASGFVPIVNWRINGKAFDPDRPIASPSYGEVEIWRFTNRRFLGLLAMVHPVHMHLVNFLVVERNGGPPLPHESGWKDTVAVDKDEAVSVIGRFGPYRGRYLLHCHNLEHEDHSMMARFDVV